MNVLLVLLSIFVSFLWGWTPQPLFAAQGTVSISAFVPGETYATTTFNFSSGGTYTFNSAATNNYCNFTFPADFYSESLNLRANSYSKTFFETNKPAPSGKDFIGKTYDFDLFNSSDTQVTAVNKAVTIVCRYSDADVSGIDESTLAPYRMGSSDSSWQLISGSTVDTANNKVTFSTTLFSSFGLFGAPPPTPPPPAPSPAPSGGGGGGGGFFTAPETKVVFFGRAYPGMKVTILKDAQIAASTIVDSAANFRVAVSGLSAGGYIFGVYSEDNQGRRSSFLTYPMTVTSGVTVEVGSIFIAPTIAVDKSEVKRGENIAIFGQSAPKADITVAISSEEEFFGKTIADAGGAYLYNFDTAQLEKGRHLTKSKAALAGTISPFSKTISFLVDTKTVFTEPSGKCPAKADLNNDCQVNLVDFSIAAYWYKRANPPATVDLNGDGKVDLIDFSIMAFYWTG